MSDKNVTISSKQADSIVNLLLTHINRIQEMKKTVFSPVTADALEEEVKKCRELLDVILPQIEEKETCGNPNVVAPASQMQENVSGNEDRNKAINYCAGWIMQYIADASKNGQRSCAFTPTSETIHGVLYDCKKDLKEMFLKQGYTFKHGIVIDGVVQRTEHICW